MSRHRPLLAAFDDQRIVPGVLECPSQAQPGDTTAGDEYAQSRVRLWSVVVDHGVLQLIHCHDQFLRHQARAIIGKRY